MKCKVHKKFSTVYPLGYVPYGRQPLLAVVPDGKPLQEPKAGAASKPDLDAPWRDTMFQAALDAAEREPWPREPEKPSNRWWPQQRRMLAWAMKLLGLGSDAGSRTALLIASVLAVPMMLLKEGIDSIRAKPGYYRRGRAICSVLRSMPPDFNRLDRLLAAGHHAGLWGQPYRWDPRTQTLSALVFQPAGTGVPPPET
jgi:hypothetical protein